MTDQPDQPPRPPAGQPPNHPPGQPAGQPSPRSPQAQPTSPAAGAGASGPTGATPPGAPRTNAWRRATSTSGGRWAVGLAAAALAVLMLLGVGLAGMLVLRVHDRFDLAGSRQDGFNRRGPGSDERGQGDGGLRDRERPRPGGPGLGDGRADGQGGLGSLLGGSALHGTVTLTVNGALQTVVFQRGEVTAVSATSITLKSADGFTGTYGRTATTSSLRSEPVRGGQALVLARNADKVAISVRSIPRS